jgi:hypothetical protein
MRTQRAVEVALDDVHPVGWQNRRNRTAHPLVHVGLDSQVAWPPALVDRDLVTLAIDGRRTFGQALKRVEQVQRAERVQLDHQVGHQSGGVAAKRPELQDVTNHLGAPQILECGAECLAEHRVRSRLRVSGRWRQSGIHAAGL